jgi:signal peptidase II
VYGWGAFVYLLDRLTKAWAEHSLAGRGPVTLVPHVLDLRFTENSGGAFSVLVGVPWLFVTATVVVALVIVALSFRVGSLPVAAALGMILGGALGNLTDRIVRGSGISGRVVDFIDVHHWPVFNVADAGITVGALLILLAGLRGRDDGEAPRTEPAP